LFIFKLYSLIRSKCFPQIFKQSFPVLVAIYDPYSLLGYLSKIWKRFWNK